MLKGVVLVDQEPRPVASNDANIAVISMFSFGIKSINCPVFKRCSIWWSGLGENLNP